MCGKLFTTTFITTKNVTQCLNEICQIFPIYDNTPVMYLVIINNLFFTFLTFHNH